MLTAKEMSDLKKLQEKEKNYEPMLDGEIDEIEKRAAAHYDGMEVKMGVMMKSWNTFAEMLSSLGSDNLKLAADLKHWKSIANKRQP